MCDQQCLRSACAYTLSDQSLCLSLEYSESDKLLTEHHLGFLSLKGGCTGSSKSTLVKLKKLLEITCFGPYNTSEVTRNKYEGCSNMNASSFITFFTYMLQQNGKRFYKGLYVTFKLAPDLKKNTIYLSSYSFLNEGHVCILKNSMLRTYTSDIDERIILRLTSEIP